MDVFTGVVPDLLDGDLNKIPASRDSDPKIETSNIISGVSNDRWSDDGLSVQ